MLRSSHGCRLRRLLAIALVALGSAAAGQDLRQADAPGRAGPPPPFRGSREVALKRFLNDELPQRERFAAGLRLVRPDEQESRTLLAFAADRRRNPELRMLALAVHRNNTQAANTALDLLGKAAEEDEAFVVGLIDYVSRWFFVVPTSQLARDTTTALRPLLKDERPGVRIHAFERLLSRNDSVAVDLASKQLEGETEPQIPDASAVAFLRRADARQHLGVLSRRLARELDAKEQDAALLAELVTAVAIDPEFHPRIVALVEQPATPAAVRRAGISSLAYHHSDRFAPLAPKVLGNPEQGAEVRKAAARAMLLYLNQDGQAAELSGEFLKALDQFLESARDLPPDARNETQRVRAAIEKRAAAAAARP